MQLVIERGELLRALGHVTSVVERRTTIPILSNVMLRAAGQALELKATDLEREVIEQASAEVRQPGALTVPAHTIHEIVRKLPDGAQIEFLREPERDRLTLTSGHARFALQTLPAEDFPRLAKPAGEVARFTLSQKALRHALGLVQYAMAQQDIRYYLNGLLMVAEDKQLKLVATDGHRLAYATLKLPGDLPRQEVIVPRKTVLELSKLLADNDEEVKIELAATQASFSFGTSSSGTIVYVPMYEESSTASRCSSR